MQFNSFLRAVNLVKESAKVFGFALKEKQIEALSSFVIHLCLCQQVMAILPSVFDRIKGRCMVCVIE